MQKPHEYICEQFKKYDAILLGEEHRIRENLLFVQELLPYLLKAGVTNVGMEFGSSEVQKGLDQLVTGEVYDEQRARDFMFHYNVTWAMKEYMDIYKAAFELNKSVGKNNKKMRILNLSYQYDWSEYRGLRYPEDSQKIFKKGTIEQFRVGVVEKEVFAKGEKILILTGTIHAFTKYQYTVYDGLEEHFYRYIQKDFGHLLYKRYGNKVATVLLHQKFPKRMMPNSESPCNGKLEQWFLEQGGVPIGIDLNENSVGELSEKSDYRIGYEDLKLRNLADGYIFLKPLKELHGATLDREFLKGRNYEDVKRNFPDPDWHPIPNTEEEYWEYLEDFVSLKDYRKGI